MGAVLLVEPFQARGEVHRIAHGGVAVAQLRAHVADGSHTGVEPDADVEIWLVLRPPLLPELGDPAHHLERGTTGSDGMAGLDEWRAPEGHHRVADIFVERARVVEHDLGHIGEILIEQKGQLLRVELLGDAGEAADIAKHDGDFVLARLHELRVLEQAPDHLRAEVILEGATDLALLLLLDQGAIEGHQAEVGNEGGDWNGEIQPPTLEERKVHASDERHDQQQAEPHPARLCQRQPNAQRNAEKENQGKVHCHLLGAAHQEVLMENVVNHVRVDFHSGVVQASVRRGAEVADAGGRGPHEHNLVPKGAGREFVPRHVGNRNIRIGAHGALVVDHHAADGVGPDANRVAELDVYNPSLIKVEHGFFVRQIEEQADRLNVQGGVKVPFRKVLRATVGQGEQGAADYAIRIGRHVEETRGLVPAGQRIGKDFDVGLCATGQETVGCVVLDQIE